MVFEKRVLRKIIGPKRDKMTGVWGKPNNEELYDLYSLPSIIRMVKLSTIRRAGHVARIGRRGMHVRYEECMWDISRKERREDSDRKTKTMVSVWCMEVGEIGWDGMGCIGRTIGRWISVAHWSDASRRA
jgi:hypothetical protein